MLSQRLLARRRRGTERRSRLAVAAGAGKVAAQYLALLPFRPRRSRAFLGGVLAYVSRYREPIVESNLPVRSMQDLFAMPDDSEVHLDHRIEPKALPLGEAYVLAAVTSCLRPRLVFEIGTFTGGATLILAAHADTGARIHTLDMPPGERLHLAGLTGDLPMTETHRVGERFRSTVYSSRITQLFGDSAAFDYRPYRGRVDLVFIDGSHSYEYVRNDSQKGLEMLSPRGTIIWDDCSVEFPGVVRALDELGASVPIFRILGTRFAVHSRFRSA
jgi:predicted O-methyltransferase YrrM